MRPIFSVQSPGDDPSKIPPKKALTIVSELSNTTLQAEQVNLSPLSRLLASLSISKALYERAKANLSDDRQRQALDWRYPEEGRRGDTYKMIGERFGVSAERSEEIIKRAISKVRAQAKDIKFTDQIPLFPAHDELVWASVQGLN